MTTSRLIRTTELALRASRRHLTETAAHHRTLLDRADRVLAEGSHLLALLRSSGDLVETAEMPVVSDDDARAGSRREVTP